MRVSYVRSVSGGRRIVSADRSIEGKSQPGGGCGKQPDGIPGSSPSPSNQKDQEGKEPGGVSNCFNSPGYCGTYNDPWWP
ncbi:hypothetical protein AB205_0078250 [Aquarana catesbeiana]|uniref:Uncharacterized protein n=1 Tax=Aquarana catesbeiana TaxID=8400 RepID=A0A2G9RDW8_AQUCT|nr:hypothetical protein AB205_0078250 [Aquarana catesbeiana]